MVVLLLPGMDGTGLLFRELRQALAVRSVVVGYPRDEVLGYDALLKRIPVPDEPFFIVAESFSGPLAIRLAASAPEKLRGVVLVATFARSPSSMPKWMTSFAVMTPPDFMLRWALLESGAPVHELRAAIQSVRPAVLARRLRDILEVDVRDALARIRVPVLALTASRDRLVSPQPEFARFEQATLDGPHLLLQTRPTETAKLISDFIERCNPRD